MPEHDIRIGGGKRSLMGSHDRADTRRDHELVQAF